MNFSRDSVLQPFHMEITPITKVILINFEQNPETIYRGLELQYLETRTEGKGHRLIAYRIDGYVDVYDEKSLYIENIGNFEVCGKGLRHYRKQALKNTYFEQTEAGVQVSFSLRDYKERMIEVVIQEQAKKKSRPIDLVAPVGASSENPTCFPAFPMYQFDLVRKKDTVLKVQIDGKDIIPDPFPVPIPKDGQMRWFTRYSCDCELVEFGGTSERTLQPQFCQGEELYSDTLKAHYKIVKGKKEMETLQFIHSKHDFVLEFEDLFPDLLRMDEQVRNGRFKIEMEPSMGYFAGTYCVKKQDNQIQITMILTEGWCVKGTMLLTKVMFQKNSIFRTWPKKYCYEQTIDLETGKSSCSWRQLEYRTLTKEWWKGK